jgi:hypothetical protein
MRLMFDSVDPLDIPEDAPIVAGYVDGAYAWPEREWQRFPRAVRVTITVRGLDSWFGAHANVLDVENGAATEEMALQWARAVRANHRIPTIYCSADTLPKLSQSFRNAGEPMPLWWVAAWPGAGAVIPAGCVAHQFLHDLNCYDLSVVEDYWPGVDPAVDQGLAQRCLDAARSLQEVAGQLKKIGL